MSRIRIQLPSDFRFSTLIPIRITDLNYGGHIGNDAILSIIHEARMQFLREAGYTEMEMEGVGMIMSDAGIEFKTEGFYGEVIMAHVTASNFSRIGFDLFYKLVKQNGETIVAIAKTGMVCYDYSKKRVVALPETAIKKLSF